MRELYDTPSSRDLSPISGYVTFTDGELRQDIVITAVDDHEEEANDVFSVKLISAMGGATVSLDQATATLTGNITRIFRNSAHPLEYYLSILLRKLIYLLLSRFKFCSHINKKSNQINAQGGVTENPGSELYLS